MTASGRGLLCALAALLAGCATTIRPTQSVDQLGPIPARFSNAAFDVVLQRYVDDRGLVDYAGLAAHRGALDHYYDLVAAYSPDATPPLFPTRTDALAYWINAYNAAVLRTVLQYYPIASVGDVDWWAPDKAGFFVLQHLTFGGVTSNLYDLENTILRERYHDPRVHFALNCGSRGCPQLNRYAFSGDVLDVQLDQAARRFVAEARNVRIDHDARRVYLSSIFKWYRDDFGDNLLDYIARYSTAERAAELQRAAAYEVEFVPYDWRLNDQSSASAS
jgi:hypothetical protein